MLRLSQLQLIPKSTCDFHTEKVPTPRLSKSYSPRTENLRRFSQGLPLSLKKKKIEDFYEITEEELGTGGYSEVRKGIHRENKQNVAVKIIDRTKYEQTPFFSDALKSEIFALSIVCHPHVVEFKEAFEDYKNTYLVTEFIEGEHLMKQVIKKGKLSESETIEVMKQTLDAVEYLHDSGFVHRDLTLQNLIYVDGEKPFVKIVDFGLSAFIGDGLPKASAGTLDYTAPEILTNEFLNGTFEDLCKSDIWSLGIVAYILLCGYLPFSGRNMYWKIVRAKFEFYSPEWDTISESAKDFISSLLVVEPRDRPTSNRCLRHEWLSNRKSQLYEFNRHREEIFAFETSNTCSFG